LYLSILGSVLANSMIVIGLVMNIWGRGHKKAHPKGQAFLVI
jgi:hypothetical protein